MAIYQFYLGAVPRKGLLLKHDSLPSKIKVSTETGYFESNTDVYWRQVNTENRLIIEEIDKIVKRADWGKDKGMTNWKTISKHIDNDAFLLVNETTNHIEELSFRADLRDKRLVYLKNVIALGEKFDWLFIDRKGQLVNPDFEEVKILIRESDNLKFLMDPYKFFEDLNSRK